MAISKKRARKIVVDGKQFYWKVSKNGTLHLVVFRKEDDVELKIVVNYSKDEKKVILPNEVRKFILLAFKDGLSLENPTMVYSEI